MSEIEFLVLLAALVWIWWIVPRRRFTGNDSQKILDALERIETKLGTNPDIKPYDSEQP